MHRVCDTLLLLRARLEQLHELTGSYERVIVLLEDHQEPESAPQTGVASQKCTTSRPDPAAGDGLSEGSRIIPGG